MLMHDEVRALYAAHLRTFPNFLAHMQHHQTKIGFMMEFCGDNKTGEATTLLDVIYKLICHKTDTHSTKLSMLLLDEVPAWQAVAHLRTFPNFLAPKWSLSRKKTV